MVRRRARPLAPRLTEPGVHRLAVAICGAVGIESLVWLTDVAAVPRDQAAELMQWSARALLRHALTNGLPVTDRTPASPADEGG
jgi:hypothetical protein